MKKIFFLSFITIICLVASCSSLKEAHLYSGAICIEKINIIDPIDGLEENMTIVIQEGGIYKIFPSDSIRLSNDNTIINGQGKYLIPGLWDAHVHFDYDKKIANKMPSLFLAYGVTSVRDTGGDLSVLKEIKANATSSPSEYPSLYFAGPLIDGTPNVYNGSSDPFPSLSIQTKNQSDLEEKVSELVKHKVDFLKAYEMLSPIQFNALIAIAQKNDLKVTGHIPLSMDLKSAVEGGLNGMEHFRNIELSAVENVDELLLERKKMLENKEGLLGSELRSSIHQKQRFASVEQINEERLNDILDILLINYVWQTPTLVLYQNFANKTYLNNGFLDELTQLPKNVKEEWESKIATFSTEKNPKMINYANWMLTIVKKMHEKGIPFMAGTDTPIGFLIPGRSLHRELEMLVKGGMSPKEALKTATINPAKFFNLENKIGRIKEGYSSDLVMLNKNPLERISHTKSIQAVIKQGVLIDRKKLDSLLLEQRPW